MLYIRELRWREFFRLLFFSPNITSGVVVAIIFGLVFNHEYGLINNYIMKPLGLTPVRWLQELVYIMPAVIILGLWRYTGINALYFMAGLRNISLEVNEAVIIDGALELGIYWRVGLPLTRGALSVLAVLTFPGAWNDYLWPLIVLRSAEKFTYPVGLAALVGLYKVEYGMILAGAFLATLPILLIFVAGRNQLLANITLGAVKG